MREETSTRKIYQFDELSDTAKEYALQKQAEFEAEVFDPDYVLTDADTIAELLGIELARDKNDGISVYYDTYRKDISLKGKYYYKKGAVKAVKEYAPQDQTLHRIAQNLVDAQKHCKYAVYAELYHGNYNRQGIELNSEYNLDNKEKYVEMIDNALREFAAWVLQQIEKEYDYRISAEAGEYSIKAKEYEFYEGGEMV